MTTKFFDAVDPQLLNDPFGTFSRLREEHPLCSTTLGGRQVWVLSRYADVRRVLDDPTTLMRPPGAVTPEVLGTGAAARMWRAALSMMDPPDHTRVRRVVGRAFTRRRAEAMRPGVDATVAAIFDGLGSEFEAVSELALRVPARVICGVLGIDDEDWPRLESWTPDFLRIFLPDACTAAELQRMEQACSNFLEYFDELVERRRREPRDDLTSVLVALESDGLLSRDELIGALRGLLTAGFETSAATISAALLCFAAQPAQLALLKSRPELIPAAVEELLRWETPVRTQTRYLGVETSLHGTPLPAGAAIWLLLGSANHDPEQFAVPADIDFARPTIEHVAFGGGRHFCLGAYLARVELQSVFTQIVLRWQRVHADTERAQRRANLQFPSLQRLPCRVVQASRPPPAAAR